MRPRRPPRSLTVARVQAIEIAVNWRWLPVLGLGTWLLAHSVLPARFPTWEWTINWLTSAGVVLAGEGALLLHELGHAVAARRRGQQVLQIVFHGFRAETVCSIEQNAPPAPAHELLIALAGPMVNLTLAGGLELVRLTLDSQGPVEVGLVLLLIGNLAAAAMSLVPLGASDGARALRALRDARSSGYR